MPADIVCFSNDWDGDPLSKTHLMRLAARDRRVLWVNSIGNRAPRATTRDVRRLFAKLAGATRGVREVESNLFVLSPLALPPLGNAWTDALNGRLLGAQVRLALGRLGMDRPIAISFLPAAAPAFDRFDARLRVYHCVDEFSAFAGAGEAIRALEQELMKKSDLVICSAERLQREKAKHHPHVALVRHGVDVAHFSRTLDPELEVHPLVRPLKRPVLGFMGLVAEWVDQGLLAEVARAFPHGTLVVIGRENVDTSTLRALPNVVFTGRRPYAELPSLLKGLDVGLCAFTDSTLTRAANPLKVREYIAAGLPVVSTPIPEVQRLGLCHIARSGREFVAAIEAALAVGAGPSRDRTDSMRSESWEARWHDVEALFEDALDAPARRRSA